MTTLININYDFRLITMNMNDERRIVEALEETNRWWKNTFTIEFKPREKYPEIQKFFKTKQILALTGLRRVGKTTILLKLVEEYLKDHNALDVLYFSFDDFRDVGVKEIITTYARLLNKDLTSGQYLFLFDEIQKLDNWAEQVKRIYDTYKNIKIIVSGSESLFIKKKSRESLAGRFFEFKIDLLRFTEYLQFKDKKRENIELYREEILREFQQYLFSNGFPELIDQDKDFIDKYIKENIIEKIIYKDIPQVFPVKNPSVLEDILKIIISNPGQIINIDDFAKDLGISRQTVVKYLYYLEKSFLIKKLYNFSRNVRKTERKLKKYYPVILLPNIIEQRESIGKVFETCMVLQLDAEFFWRDQYKNEVDVIQVIGETIVPIEIKYTKTEHKPLHFFMKKFNVQRGIIITYDSKKSSHNQKEITVIPFYEYLLK